MRQNEGDFGELDNQLDVLAYDAVSGHVFTLNHLIRFANPNLLIQGRFKVFHRETEPVGLLKLVC